MTGKGVQGNITILGIVALSAIAFFGLITSNDVYAQEEEEYKLLQDILPVLTFTFRDGIETREFPIFRMGENFVENSGTSFSVQGTATHSPLLYQALDEAYKYRFSNAAFDHQFKYFDVAADFVQADKSILTLSYKNCRVDNYQIETLDSNNYESYFKDVGFAIVDKIDFVCSGVKPSADTETPNTADIPFTDFGTSGFKFANDIRTSVTFMFENGMEKIEFPVFNLVSGYEESTDNVIAEFQVEGVLDFYPLLYEAIDKSRKVSGITTASNVDFNALVEFTNGDSVLRGFDFNDCRVSDSQITTRTDKEEGFTRKSGFVQIHQLTFTCSGIDPINIHYDNLRGDAPVWTSKHLSNTYVEPIQNTDKGLSALATFTFADGTETVEFSMFKQNKVLTVTESLRDQTITSKATYPTIEFRGIVGDYPILYNYVDNNRKVHGVSGTQFRELVDIDVALIYDEATIRDLSFANCRTIDYVISTQTGSEESYIKNKFALVNIFDFECQGYHPNNPLYDAMFNTKQADTMSTLDLRETQRWGAGFYVP